jgi:hypothetical protein
MNAADYDENAALDEYIRRSYPEMIRPHDGVPSHEWIHDHLPAELRKEYQAHAAECDAIIQRTRAWAKKHGEETGSVVEVLPDLPSMKPGLSTAFHAVFKEFRANILKKVLEAHGASIVICRCCRCNRILKSRNAQQCLWCGYDWHPASRPNDG